MSRTDLTCTRCGATIDAASVDAERQIATCGSCRSLVDMRPQLAERAATTVARQRASVPLPNGMRIERGVGDNVTISRRWLRGKHAIFAVLFAGLGVALAYAWRQHGTNGLLIAAAVVLAVWTLRLLSAFVNTTTVEVRSDTVSVTHGPIPSLVFRPQQLRAEQIEQLFAAKFGSLYQVSARLRDGTTVALVRALVSPEQALFVEQQLEAALGIVDFPVLGELSTAPGGPRRWDGLVFVGALLFAAGGTAMVFWIGSSKVEGTLEGSGDAGAWSLAPDRCASGETRGFYGVDLGSSEAPSTFVRLMRDPMGTTTALVQRGEGPALTYNVAMCTTLDVSVEQTNTVYNEVRVVRGAATIDCPGLRGTVTFDGCH